MMDLLGLLTQSVIYTLAYSVKCKRIFEDVLNIGRCAANRISVLYPLSLSCSGNCMKPNSWFDSACMDQHDLQF